MRAVSAILLRLALTAGTLGALAGVPGPAAAAPLRDCTRTRGTIIAVDFAHWGGPIVRGCGVREHSGYALLHAAGFTTAGDQHDGPAFICRLGDSAFRHGTQYPTPRQDNCILTPPASAYWSYWLAAAGSDRWTYSQLGAMSEPPKPGEVELWTFGSTNIAGTKGSAVPSVSPDSLRPPRRAVGAPHTSTAAAGTRQHSGSTKRSGRGHAESSTSRHSASTTPDPTATTITTVTTTTSTAAPPVTRSSATQTTTHESGQPVPRRRHRPHRHRSSSATRPRHHRRAGAPVTTATSASTNSTTTSAGGERIVAARPTSQRSSSGSATPLIVGGVLALMLCAGAGRAVWLRRREE